MGVLEAVLAACIMLSAALYVQLNNDVPVRSARVDADLQIAADDFMRTAADHPIFNDPCNGTSELERLVFSGVRGDHGDWNARKLTMLGAGVDADLYIDNRFALLPLHARGGFKGITSDVLIQPDLTYGYAAPVADGAAGTDALRVSVPVVAHSSLRRAPGEAMVADLLTSNTAGTMAYRQAGVSAVTDQGGSMFWRSVATHEPQDILDLAATADATPFNPGDSIALELELHDEGENSPIIEIGFPPGWEVESENAEPMWTHETLSPGRHQFIGHYAASLQILDLRATPPPTPLHPFDIIHAQVTNSSLASADLLVKYAASTDTDFPRTVTMTTPYPVARGEDATFGVAFANGAEATTITNVTLAVPGGYDFEHNDGLGAPLFEAGGSVTPIDAPAGTWSIWDAKHVSWTGSVDVDALGAQQWIVNVPITSDPGIVTSIDSTFRRLPNATATFENGYAQVGTRWGRVPGILELEIPNATYDVAGGQENADGYPHADGLDASDAAVQHDFTVTGSLPRGSVRAAASYNVSPVASSAVQLQSSVANSTFAVANRIVPVGTDVAVDANLESLMTTASSLGASGVNLTLELYAPPSMGCAPTAAWTWPAGSFPLARADDIAFVHPAAGSDSFVFASGAGRAYDVLPLGLTAWRAASTSGTSNVATATVGARSYVLGAGAGVWALDAADGSAAWSQPGANASRALRVNESSATLLAVGPEHVQRLRLSDGAALARLDRAAILDAQETSDGGLLVLNATRVARLDASWSVTAERDVTTLLDGGMGLAPAGLFARDDASGQVLLLDPDSLATRAAFPFAGALLDAVGDATGDGVPDFVVVAQTGVIQAFDGARGAVAWTANALDPGATLNADFVDDDVYGGRGIQSDCGDELELFSYVLPNANERPSCTSFAVGQLDLAPTSVRVGSGRTAILYGGGDGAGVVRLVGSDGSDAWRRSGVTGSVPSAIALGSWQGTDVVAIGTEEGRVMLVAATTNAQVLTYTPSDVPGAFHFAFHLPLGAFFGSHLVVATLNWTQDDGRPETPPVHQAARLVDWFEVVAPDGTPVTNPTYRVALVVSDRAHPAREACYQSGHCPNANED